MLIETDDALVARVMGIHRLPSTRAAVEYALLQLVAAPLSRDEALEMDGLGWGDSDALLASRQRGP